MTRALVIVVIVCMAFASGWFAHRVYTYDPQSGLQWQFTFAARRGDLAAVQRYVQQGAKIDAEPTYAGGAVSGFPALFLAADAGEADVVEWLLTHGAEPNRQVADSTPLAAAEHRISEATRTVAILKARGAKHPQP